MIPIITGLEAFRLRENKMLLGKYRESLNCSRAFPFHKGELLRLHCFYSHTCGTDIKRLTTKSSVSSFPEKNIICLWISKCIPLRNGKGREGRRYRSRSPIEPRTLTLKTEFMGRKPFHSPFSSYITQCLDICFTSCCCSGLKEDNL